MGNKYEDLMQEKIEDIELLDKLIKNKQDYLASLILDKDLININDKKIEISESLESTKEKGLKLKI